MKFIPKKVLTEAEVNPLETNGLDLSYDEQYKQAILKAVASEASATTEYSQILALEEKVSNKELVEHFHDTLEDLKNEEIKHIAQLTTKIGEIPDMREAYNAGVEEANSGDEVSLETKEDDSKENNTEEKTEDNKDSEKEDVKESAMLTEAVVKNRTYDSYNIQQIIANQLHLNDRQYEIIEDIFKYSDDELSADEVDAYLEKVSTYFNISENKLSTIEDAIIQSSDPQLERKQDFESDIKYDIDTLTDAIEKVYSLAAKEKLFGVIEYLKKLEYDGSKEIGWRPEQSLSNKTNKRIIV